MPLTLHVVLISKLVPFEEASEIAKKIMNKKKVGFYRETPKTYRFKNISKQKFIPNKYFSKKVNQYVTLVFGELKDEFKNKPIYNKKVGGFLENLYGVAHGSKMDGYNNTSSNTLRRFGDHYINKIQIYRTPLPSAIETALKLATLGKSDEIKKKFGYDKFFHLSMICSVGGGGEIVVEKNEVVNISDTHAYDVTGKTEVYKIDLGGKHFELIEMLNKARQTVGDATFFSYNVRNNNCQFFIKYLLEGQGLWDADVAKFVMQDIDSFLKELPSHIEPIANFFTDLGAQVNELSGAGDAYCGMLGVAPKGKHLGSLAECIKAKQVRRYGIKKASKSELAKLKDNVKLKNKYQKELNKLETKHAGLFGKIKKLTKDLIQDDSKTSEILKSLAEAKLAKQNNLLEIKNLEKLINQL